MSGTIVSKYSLKLVDVDAGQGLLNSALRADGLPETRLASFFQWMDAHLFLLDHRHVRDEFVKIVDTGSRAEAYRFFAWVIAYHNDFPRLTLKKSGSYLLRLLPLTAVIAIGLYLLLLVF